MTATRNCIKANFTGYYVLRNKRGSKLGTTNLHEINEWKGIELTEVEEIADYSSESQKLGNYLYYPDLENLQIKVPEGVLGNQRLYDILLKDVEITFILDEHNKKWVKAKGVFYGSLIDTKKREVKKPIPEAELHKSTTVESAPEEEDAIHIEQTVGAVQTNAVAANEGCGNRLQQWTNPKKGSWLGNLNNRFNSSRMNRANQNYDAGVQQPDSSESDGRQQQPATPNSGSGCRRVSGCYLWALRIIGILFIAYGGYGLYSNGFGDYTSWGNIALGLLMVVASFSPRLRGVIGSLLGLFLLLYILGTLISYFSNGTDWDWSSFDTRDEEEVQWDEERETQEVSDTTYAETDQGTQDELDADSAQTDQVNHYYQHNHNWKRNNGNNLKGQFRVNQKHFPASKNHRERMNVNAIDDRTYWGSVYSGLFEHDQTQMPEILAMYEKIGKEKKLNRNEFADMVVTSVQWIPYVLVLEKGCKESIADGGFVTEYLMQGKPCLGNIKFGIQSPTEFMSNFKGDCDTRSVFCFMVLDHFGYDAAVLVSVAYGHAILGINMNVGGGDFVKHKGKRYYGWETTATGFSAGNLSPECSNMRNWKVALAN